MLLAGLLVGHDALDVETMAVPMPFMTFGMSSLLE